MACASRMRVSAVCYYPLYRPHPIVLVLPFHLSTFIVFHSLFCSASVFCVPIDQVVFELRQAFIHQVEILQRTFRISVRYMSPPPVCLQAKQQDGNSIHLQ